jgi:hypothetical protein
MKLGGHNAARVKLDKCAQNAKKKKVSLLSFSLSHIIQWQAH